MNSRHYELRFLPLFEEDLNEIVEYISGKLRNPEAAAALVDEIQAAIESRASCAEAFEKYHSSRERRYPYYRIYVKNFTVYYVVFGDVMEVRRIVYNRRNQTEQI